MVIKSWKLQILPPPFFAYDHIEGNAKFQLEIGENKDILPPIQIYIRSDSWLKTSCTKEMTQPYRCLVMFKVTSKSHKTKKPSFLPLSIRHRLHLYLGRQPCWGVDVFTGFFGEVASLKNTWVGLQER